MIASCLLALSLSSCGWVIDSAEPAPGSADASAAADGLTDTGEKAPTTKPIVTVASTSRPSSGGSTSSTPSGTNTTSTPTTSTPTTTTSTPPASTSTATQSKDWLEIAVRDMRAADGSYARNDDRLLHRTLVSPSSQADRASLTMGRYGTKEAFTTRNPDYQKELAWVPADDPVRFLEAWPRINLWDQVFLSERWGPNHAPGYTGNSRVRTWGYELWVKNKAGKWSRLFKTDTKSGEAWRPTFKGGANFESYAFDLRKEADGSTSVQPQPALGYDSSGSYWIPHGYAGGVTTVDPYDIQDVLVLCWSQLVLDDPKGFDDRQHARFLFGVGFDWYPPAGQKLSTYPGGGTSRHKYVTTQPTLHVMHTMTEAEFRANPPPR